MYIAPSPFLPVPSRPRDPKSADRPFSGCRAFILNSVRNNQCSEREEEGGRKLSSRGLRRGLSSLMDRRSNPGARMYRSQSRSPNYPRWKRRALFRGRLDVRQGPRGHPRASFEEEQRLFLCLSVLSQPVVRGLVLQERAQSRRGGGGEDEERRRSRESGLTVAGCR